MDKIIELSKFKEAEARRLLEQLMQAVNYLHQQSICHRQIQPHNILLSSKDNDSRVLLADFGNASVLWTDDDGNFLPLTDPLPGSVIYHAPEALKKDSEGYGKEIDIWSVGCVAYIMMSGVAPFLDSSDEELAS